MSSSVPRLLPIAAFFLLPLLSLPSPTAAQSTPDSTRADTLDSSDQKHLEPFLDSFETIDHASNQLSEQFAHLAEHPYNLNDASAAELAVLPSLSLVIAQRIVEYRRANGPFSAVGDIWAVDGVTENLVRAVHPFLHVEKPVQTASRSFSYEAIRRTIEVDVIQRMSQQLDLGRGYHTGRFRGAPYRLTTRVHLQSDRHLEVGLTLDKDPGERLEWAPGSQTYLFDHLSWTGALHDVGRLTTLVLGHFTVQFGQGVGLWQGLRFGKGRDPVGTAFVRGRGVLPYTSASEANYLRGVGGTLQLHRNLYVTAFGSHRKRDATIDSAGTTDDVPGPDPVRTVSGDGRHRTAGELERKGTFGETVFGGAVEYRGSAIHAGVAGYGSWFGRPIRPGPAPYRRYRVAGRRTSMLTAYASAHLQNYVLFGEFARSANGVYGGLVGATTSVDERIEAVVLARHYPAQFSNFHGNAFGERGGAQNEMGIYTGVEFALTERWTVRSYFDQYRFPWIRFGVGRPSVGWEARTVVEYAPRPWLETYLQFRVEDEEQGADIRTSTGQILDGLQSERRQSARLHVEYAFSDRLTLRTRTELANHSTPAAQSQGVFLAQGFRYTPIPSLQVDARIAVFDTDGYDARIYAYEHDLLYSFSVPVFFDRGRRSYVLVEYNPTADITVEAKYGVTRYDNRTSIGSGLNRIMGSRKRHFAVQLRIQI